MKDNLIFLQKIKPGLIVPARVKRFKRFDVQVVTDGKILINPNISIPTKKKGINPTSNLAKWKSFYGKYPFSNQKVFLVMNEKGNLVFPYEIQELKRYDDGLSDLQKLEKYVKRFKKNGIRNEKV